MASIDILVVDDRAVDADATLHAIRRASSDAKVIWLKSGNEALQYLFSIGEFRNRRPGMPKIALLDHEMPTMSGLCALEIVRAHPLTRQVPVALVSDLHDPVAFNRNGRLAADAYVVRSCDLDRYCKQIELVLARWLPRSKCPSRSVVRESDVAYPAPTPASFAGCKDSLAGRDIGGFLTYASFLQIPRQRRDAR